MLQSDEKIIFFSFQLHDELQTPSSEGSAAAPVSGGAIPRRSSAAATRKPATTDEMHVNLVMKMGFNRKIVELAVRTLRKSFEKFDYNFTGKLMECIPRRSTRDCASCWTHRRMDN